MSRTLQQYRFERKLHNRLYLFSSVIFLVILVLIFRLVSLQLLYGYENRILAKKFVSHQEFTVAPRGLIFDRSSSAGELPLVQNIRFIDFVLYPGRFESYEDAKQYVKRFSQAMGRDYEDYAQYFTPKNWKKFQRKNMSITLLERITRREHERIAALKIALQHGEYVTRHLRHYTMGPAFAHVSGYIGLPSKSHLEKRLAQSYQTIGKAGIEARYDSALRGRDGIRIRHRVIASEEQILMTQQGDHLFLNIDRDMQAAAYRALLKFGRRGAVIAMNPSNGALLALVSHPSFDPNILSSGDSKQREEHLQQVKNHNGFLNLAIQAKFPPASAFKPLVALAALETSRSGIVSDTTHFCSGKFVLKSMRPGIADTQFGCWSRHGHLAMIDSIAHSCNVYFYNTGYNLGPTPIIEFARSFGMDKITGIDLPGEMEGRVPDKRWKELHLSSRWYDGDTINLAIGQGFLQTTPIELAVFYSALANQGKIYRPYLVREIRDSIQGQLIQRFEPELVREVPISVDSFDTVHQGMLAVVNRGTARVLRKYGLPIAGKTGTVQTASKKKGVDHSWFAGFAPYGAPVEEQVVVVVFIEYGIAGSYSAAPVAGEVWKAAFPDWSFEKTQKIMDQLKQKAAEKGIVVSPEYKETSMKEIRKTR